MTLETSGEECWAVLRYSNTGISQRITDAAVKCEGDPISFRFVTLSTKGHFSNAQFTYKYVHSSTVYFLISFQGGLEPSPAKCLFRFLFKLVEHLTKFVFKF